MINEKGIRLSKTLQKEKLKNEESKEKREKGVCGPRRL